MGTHTLATLPKTTTALANDLVLIHKMPEDETYAITAADFRTVMQEDFVVSLGDITGVGSLAGLDSIDTSYVSSLGMLAALDEVGMYNMITNPFLNYWTAGTSLANPTGWSTVGSAQVYQETTIYPEQTNCSAKVVANGQLGSLRAGVSLYEYNYGNPLSFSAWVYATAAAKVRLSINITDGVSTTSLVSSYHPGDSTWQLLTVDGLTVPVSSTLAYGQIDVASGATGYMTFAALVWGARAPRYLHPRGWYNPTGASGFVNNGSYLGFFRNDGWRVYLDSSGNFICRTNDGDYAFRYYGTSSGVYGEGDLFLGSTTAGEGSMWWDQSSAMWTLDGTFRLRPGHDFWLAGGSGDYAEIRFYGTSGWTGAYSSLRALYGPQLDMSPSGAGSGTLEIGNYYRWLTANMHAKNVVRLDTYHDANNQAYLQLVSSAATGEIDFFACNSTAGYVLRYMVQSGYIGMIPANAGVINLGTDTYDWDILYCTATDTTDDVNYFDEHDDLGDIMKIRPLVDRDGNQVLDKHGLPIIDDSTLPPYVVSIAQDDRPAIPEERDGATIIHPARVKGQPIMTHDGKCRSRNTQWYGLFLGSIRQLNSKVDSYFAALDARLTRIEQGGRDAV